MSGKTLIGRLWCRQSSGGLWEGLAAPLPALWHLEKAEDLKDGDPGAS